MKSAFTLSCALCTVGSQASQLRNMSAESDPDTMYEPLTITESSDDDILDIDSESCGVTVFEGLPSDGFVARSVRAGEVILFNGCV